MVNDCPSLTLSEIADEFLINNFIDKKKNYAAYLIIAKRAWQKVFTSTFWSTKNEWLTVQAGTPYNYINIPKDAQRIFSVNVEDDCGLIQPLYYNSQLNVIPKPTIKSCGCKVCDCGGMCDSINSSTVTTKLLFTINAVNYYQKCWIKYCDNGCIIQYCETPVKKYNDLVGILGDFNNDFNDDFFIGNPGMANYTVVTEITQQKICQLKTKPCGCPENTPENESLLASTCGCFLPLTRKKHCDQLFQNINNNCRGEVKISECGNKMYYKPQPHHGHQDKIPDFLLLNYQTNGLDVSEQTTVPDFAIDFLMAEIDFRRKRFNSKYTLNEKQMAMYERNREENLVISFLNPISLETLSNVQDAEIKF